MDSFINENKKKRTPIAWLNLIHTRVKFLVSIGGITFAVFLIFMQLGFFGAVLNSATLVYDNLNFDILLISNKSLDATVAQPISRSRLYQIKAVSGVESAMPLYVGFKQWRNLETKVNRAILVMGFNPKDQVFRIPEVSNVAELLNYQGNLLLDKLSRSEYGKPKIGAAVNLGNRNHRLAGLYTMGTALRFDGSVIVSDVQFTRIFAGSSTENINLGLISVDSVSNVGVIIEQIRQILPSTIEVLSRREAEFRDQKYWVVSTSIGYIFGTGAVMGFIVGAVISYQALYQNVTEYLHEYATLKAIGYSNFYISWIVVKQANMLGFIGFILGFILANGAYNLTSIATNLPIYMTLSRMIGVLLISLLMCTISGIVSIKKVLNCNPAELFT